MIRLTACLILASALLSACSSSAVQPTLSPTPRATATAVPTRTSTPRITPTPALPPTISFDYEPAIADEIVDLVKTTVNQAYWFYVGLGCSSDGFNVTITGFESGEASGSGDFVVGWRNSSTDPSVMETRVSHETAHVMCQYAFTSRPSLRWLVEGVANYFAALERITNSGMLSGWRGTIGDHDLGMAEWIGQDFCGVSLRALEGARADRVLPEFGGVGEVAARLLAKTSPGGIQALIDYFVLSASMPYEAAFQQAFGRSQDEFYEQYRIECEDGFPSLPADLATPAVGAGEVRMYGKIVLKDAEHAYTDYLLSFCEARTPECSPGLQIRSDGTFSTSLPPGKYRISVNAVTGGEAIGWYSSDGLVRLNTCADTVPVRQGEEVFLEIDLHFVTCLP